MKISITIAAEIDCGSLSSLIKMNPEIFVEPFVNGVEDGIKEKLPTQMTLNEIGTSYHIVEN